MQRNQRNAGNDEERVTNFLGAWIEPEGDEWVVCMLADGTRKVLGRHATETRARAALLRLNESPVSES